MARFFFRFKWLLASGGRFEIAVQKWITHYRTNHASCTHTISAHDSIMMGPFKKKSLSLTAQGFIFCSKHFHKQAEDY